MAIRKILIWPDVRLLQVSEPVWQEENIDQLLIDMQDTLKAVNGLGLAAIQIGTPKRIILFKKGATMVAAINPEIIWKGPESEFTGEGCLSLPNETFDTKRSTELELRSYDYIERETFFDCTLKELEAVEVQHEIDHLDGKLLVMRPEVGRMRRDMIRRRLVKYKRSLR